MDIFDLLDGAITLRGGTTITAGEPNGGAGGVPTTGGDRFYMLSITHPEPVDVVLVNIDNYDIQKISNKYYGSKLL